MKYGLERMTAQKLLLMKWEIRLQFMKELLKMHLFELMPRDVQWLVPISDLLIIELYEEE